MHLLFNRKECIKAKNKLGKNSVVGTIWKDYFAPSNKIGNCTNLYRKLQPSSCEDFYNKYINYALNNSNLPITKRGLSYNELITLAERYKQLTEEKTNLKYDLETYFYDALCHVIIETWDGQQNERDFILFLKKLGYTCSKFDGKIDTEYGVDIKVTRNDGRVSAIQIKPITFFKSNRSDVQSDRINLCNKYEKTLKDLGIKTYYAIYSKDKATGNVTWLKNGSGYRFRINELFNYDPSDIRGTFTRCALPNITEKLPI